MNLSQQKKAMVLYTGNQTQTRSEGISVKNWKDFLLRR
jgi:hypothetical protein